MRVRTADTVRVSRVQGRLAGRGPDIFSPSAQSQKRSGLPNRSGGRDNIADDGKRKHGKRRPDPLWRF